MTRARKGAMLLALAAVAAVPVGIAQAKSVKPKNGTFLSSDLRVRLVVKGGKVTNIFAKCTFTSTGVEFPMQIDVKSKIKNGKFSFKTPDRSTDQYDAVDPMTVSGKFTAKNKAKISVKFDLAGKCTPGTLNKSLKLGG